MYHELSDAFNNSHVQFMLNEKSNSYFCVTLAKAGVSWGYTTFLGITIRNTNHRHISLTGPAPVILSFLKIFSFKKNIHSIFQYFWKFAKTQFTGWNCNSKTCFPPSDRIHFYCHINNRLNFFARLTMTGFWCEWKGDTKSSPKAIRNYHQF